MQAFTVYNATQTPHHVRYIGTVQPGAPLSGLVPSHETDADFLALMGKAPAMGLAFVDVPRGLPAAYAGMLWSAAFVAQTGVGAIAATRRFILLTAGTYAATLPAANAVPANTILYFHTTIPGGALNVAITRAGADTINGGAGPLAFAAPATTLRLQSDGVSNWTTV